ncbi:hypothetical protein M9H77_33450 [Catharanthus roseus]|uniref:Uncharacterized protein n=1 Tax=Catharanthus roseus TaxID=4058 RepID=A0ACB9ZJ84_CATRO|nr:hypothetical protein M9H77_33450 [Catharanthus roseus]
MFDNSALPQWLKSLLAEKFFNACIIHEDAKKNEKNVFCLDCREGICPNCLSLHSSHRLLQIRRYVYHDVLRLCDAEKLMNCEFVQSYTTNQAKVVFINQRPQTKSSRGSNHICIICDRALQERYLFCSLSCKIHHILQTGDKLSKYIYDCQNITLSEPGLDDGQMTPDTVLESAGSMRTESGSSGSGGMGGGIDCCRTLGCTATTEIVRKKRTGLRPVCGPVLEISNRRKGTPHRSPLY